MHIDIDNTYKLFANNYFYLMGFPLFSGVLYIICTTVPKEKEFVTAKVNQSNCYINCTD